MKPQGKTKEAKNNNNKNKTNKQTNKKQHPTHPQPTPPYVQCAVGCGHQESESTAAKERAETDHQPSQKSSSSRNEPSSSDASVAGVGD